MKKFSVIPTISLLLMSLFSLLAMPQIAQANGGVTNATNTKAVEAASVWQTILEQDASNAIAHYNLGIALGHQAKWHEAIATYRTAIQLDPSLTAAYINLGEALVMTGQLEAATLAYRTAVRLDPSKQSLVFERLQRFSASPSNLAVQL